MNENEQRLQVGRHRQQQRSHLGRRLGIATLVAIFGAGTALVGSALASSTTPSSTTCIGTTPDAEGNVVLNCVVPMPSASTVTLPAPDPSTVTETVTKTVTVTAPASTVPPMTTTPPPTTTPPSTTRFPDASNTGVPDGVSLTNSGSITVRTNGAVISGLHVTGTIDVYASNVTIRNTWITGSGYWAIAARGSSLLVEDVTIDGTADQGINNINGGNLVVRRADISGGADGISSNHGVIEDSYLHDPRSRAGDHTDMIQSLAGPRAGESLMIRHNTIINTNEQTSAVALFQDYSTPQHDTTIENNYLAGGGYTLYGGDGPDGIPYNIKILNNVFGRTPAAQYGPVAYWNGAGPGNVWSGNVWSDGKLVTP